ncbi:MAG: shikimate kinase [Pseudomonadota bacterium]
MTRRKPATAQKTEGSGAKDVSLHRTVALVGLMGAGKTSVGQVLARRLSAPFADSDHEIERAAGLSVPEIFARFGEGYFRDGERRVIARLLDGAPLILATGGGAYVEEETRRIIRDRAIVVWLRVDLDTLFERVRGRAGRPLLANDDPKGTLARLAQSRAPSYGTADLIVDGRSGERHEAAAARILKALRAHDATASPETRILDDPAPAARTL